MKNAPRFGISILGEEHREICLQLASKGRDRFAGVAWLATTDGAVLLEGASAWFECSLSQSVSAGDHEIAVFHVDRLQVVRDIQPLVFHGSRFKQLSPDVG
jgi:flavin reductase (DIM6/NTAB) family NADH-FMN oxidoreductase RutF